MGEGRSRGAATGGVAVRRYLQCCPCGCGALDTIGADGTCRVEVDDCAGGSGALGAAMELVAVDAELVEGDSEEVSG